MSFIAYQIKKLVTQRIMIKITSISNRFWSAIFCVIVYLAKDPLMMNLSFVRFWTEQPEHLEHESATEWENL